ncbi:GGDEF domain-containing protein [Chitinilyticum litopenaei]|uniref:GGDEF domain-containing protein n=1 Tax=Chitinilyticum litopenaei TaxID=1121276 RepID=UPI000417667D|nr:GGDEF domain-containing protein [Chitinilyticum litopenaei]
MTALFSAQQLPALILFGAVAHLAIGGMLWYVWRSRQTGPGFGFWVATELVIAGGYILLVLRGSVPALQAPLVLLGNALFLSNPLLYELGLRRFFPREQLGPAWVAPLLAGSFVLANLVALLAEAPPHLRFALMASASVCQLLWLLPQLLRVAGSSPYCRPLRIMALLLVIILVVQVLRTAQHLPLASQPGQIFEDPLLGLILLLTVLASIVRGNTDLILIHSRAELALRNAQAELEVRANIDSLSGLLNRHCFEARLQARLASSARQPFTLLLFDVDRFKLINDQCGHPAGDAVIRALGEGVRAVLREADLAGRLGGDEIAILLPACSLAQLPPVLARLRASVANCTARVHGPGITLSIGATDCKAGEDFAQLYHRADLAMYAAKEGGRNCACSLAGGSEAALRIAETHNEASGQNHSAEKAAGQYRAADSIPG